MIDAATATRSWRSLARHIGTMSSTEIEAAIAHEASTRRRPLLIYRAMARLRKIRKREDDARIAEVIGADLAAEVSWLGRKRSAPAVERVS